jgi:hypothetical protein
MIIGVWIEIIKCLIGTLMMNKPSANKLVFTCGAQDFKWRFSVEEDVGVGCKV